eukprot:2836541-Amphidinium_carterae.2
MLAIGALRLVKITWAWIHWSPTCPSLDLHNARSPVCSLPQGSASTVEAPKPQARPQVPWSALSRFASDRVVGWSSVQVSAALPGGSGRS